MSRRISLPGRRHFEGQSTDVQLVLIEITHPALDAPLRLSTDTTERLSTDPLRYGTRSNWRDADPVSEPWQFVAADWELPGEIEDTMPEARLVLSMVNSALIEVLQSVNTAATCNLALVLASNPDEPEQQYLGLELTTADADLSSGASVELVLSHLPIDIEYFPADRMTPRDFPGLFR